MNFQVTLRSELDELEQQNILEADAWAFSRRMNPVTEVFGRGLHSRMFGDVWRWAGTYRTSNKNLGVDRTLILSRLYRAGRLIAFLIRQRDGVDGARTGIWLNEELCQDGCR